jgi:hypothetical protein
MLVELIVAAYMPVLVLVQAIVELLEFFGQLARSHLA